MPHTHTPYRARSFALLQRFTQSCGVATLRMTIVHNHDVRFGIALGLIGQLLLVLPLLALASISLFTAVLLLAFFLTGVIGAILVLSIEWKGIWNLRRVESMSLAGVEYRQVYLPTFKRIAVTILLTVVLPISAWQAGAQMYEQVGSGTLLVTESEATEDSEETDVTEDALHGAGSGETLSGSVLDASGATLSGAVIEGEENKEDEDYKDYKEYKDDNEPLQEAGSGATLSGVVLTGSGDALTASGESLSGAILVETGAFLTETGSVLTETGSDILSATFLTNGAAIPVIRLSGSIPELAILTDKLSAELKQNGKTIETDIAIIDTFPDLLVTVSPTETLEPGIATLTLSLRDGGIRGIFGGGETLIEEEIVIGQLIANTSRDADGTTIDAADRTHGGMRLDASLLSEEGRGVCGSEMIATIDGASTTFDQSSSCKRRKISTDADYSLNMDATGTVTVTASGHTAILPITTPNNSLTITRSSVTRTYADQVETMAITIGTNTDFIATITEMIPEGVEISEIGNGGSLEARGKASSIVWERQLIAGTPVTLTYSYIIDTAPLLVPFGPLKIAGLGEESIREQGSWMTAVSLDDGNVTEVSEEITELTLTQKSEGSINAGESAKFTLLDIDIDGTDGDVMSEQDAHAHIASAIIRRESILEAAVDSLVQGEAENIAGRIVQDGDAFNAVSNLAQDVSASRARSIVSEKVIDILSDSHDARKGITEMVALQTETLIDPTLTQTIKDDIVAAVSEGKNVQDVIENAMDGASAEDTALIREAIGLEVEKNVEDVAEAIANEENKENKDDKDYKDDEEVPLIRVQLTNKSGKKISPNFSFEQGSVVLVIEPERAFEPGLYTLEVIVTDPLTAEEHVLTQDFAWGVLAMNTDQDRYLVGQTGSLAIGVLDDEGKIVCDAKLQLTVTAPSGMTSNFSSQKPNILAQIFQSPTPNPIVTTGTCGQKDSMSVSPDYEAILSFEEEGTYTLKLVAETENGVREMTQTVGVGDSGLGTRTSESVSLSPNPDSRVPFIIRRSAATRLYPVGLSPMTIIVEFLEDFEGTIVETVPGEFEVFDVIPSSYELPRFAKATPGERVTSDETTGNSKLETGNSAQTISWQGTWKKGTTATFSYLYDAPNISPQFYLMGPLELHGAFPASSRMTAIPLIPVREIQERERGGEETEREVEKQQGNGVVIHGNLLEIDKLSIRKTDAESKPNSAKNGWDISTRYGNTMLAMDTDTRSEHTSASFFHWASLSRNIAGSVHSIANHVTTLLFPRAIANTSPPVTNTLAGNVIWKEARSWQLANDDITWRTPPGPGTFTYKKKLTIANAQVDADLTNFPLLVKIANDTDFKTANVQADGDDIRFTTATGMNLPFETEQFTTSTTSGSGLFWVKIPTIKATGNSSSGAQIYVLYGSGTAVNGQNRTAVWSNGFAGVWHMSGSTLSTRDSTANANHGTNNGATAIAGKVDGAAEFDGSSDLVTHQLISAGSVYTIMIWANLHATDDVVWGGASSHYFIYTDATNFYHSAGTPEQNYTGTPHNGVTGWHHWVVTRNGGASVSFYKDGSLLATSNLSGDGMSSLSLSTIGAYAGGALSVDGLLDEPRISSVARSAAWIKFEYANMNDPLGTVTTDTPSFSKVWDGGGADNNWSTAGNWSDNTVPTASDDVMFDGTSAKNVTIDVAAFARSLNMENFTGTMTHAAGITLTLGDATAGAGNKALDFGPNMTYTLGNGTTSAITFLSSSSITQQTIDFAGKNTGNVTFGSASVGGNYQLVSGAGHEWGTSAVNASQTTTLTKGTLDTNGQTVYWGIWSSANSNVRELTLGASTIEIMGNNWDFRNSGVPLNITLNAGTSLIKLNNTSPSFQGGQKTYNSVTLTNCISGSITDENTTIANLTINGADNISAHVILNFTYVVTSNLVLTGYSSTKRLLIRTYYIGSPRTLTVVGATVSNSQNVDFRDITFVGSPDFSAIAGGSGDAGGNTGATFTTADDWYWYNSGAGTYNFSDYSHWYTETNGGGSQMASTRVVLPQDNAFFDGNSVNGTTTVDQDMPRVCKSLDFTGVDAMNFHLDNVDQTIYGGLTLSSNVTVTPGSKILYFEGRGTFNLITATKTLYKVTIQMVDGTLTLLDALTVTNNFTLASGTFDANTFDVTVAAFITATGTKTLLMGSGTWTITFVGGWQAGATGFTSTNVGETSTLILSDQSLPGTFYGAGFTYNNFLTGSGAGALTITGNNTFNNLTINGPKTVKFTAGTTTTVSNFFATGSALSPITITSTTTSPFTLTDTSGTNSVSFANISYSNATGGAGWNANNGTNTDGGGNTGWSFPTLWTGTAGDRKCSTAGNWDHGVPTATSVVLINATSNAIMWDAACPTAINSLRTESGFTGSITLSGALNTAGNLTLGSGSLLTAKDVRGSIVVGGDLTVSSGAILKVRRSCTSCNTVNGVANTGSGQSITAANITIGTGGSINADGEGFDANAGPGFPSLEYGGATHGGVGGRNSKVTYGSFTNPTSLGSGGRGAVGGGSIIVSVAGTAIVSGNLSANGANGSSNYAGDAAGGSINITATTLVGAGRISANGNTYGPSGGGRISLGNVTTNNFTGLLQANGTVNLGSTTGYRGSAGTIYFDSGTRTTWTIPSGRTYRLGSDGTNNYSFTDITIQNGGTLEIDSNPNMNSGNGGAATLNVSTLDVQNGGLISANRLGFVPTNGPGAGSSVSRTAGTYGGMGGQNRKLTYGSIRNPANLGSGGGRTSDSLDNEAGGGAIMIVASGQVTLNGMITAIGGTTTCNGCAQGGAGGTVNIITDSFVGNGLVSTNGGGYGNEPTGGGGRIAVKLTSGISFGSSVFQSFGGNSTGIKGTAGTIYLEDANDGAGNGELIIDNNNVATAGGTDTLISSSVTDASVGTVTVRNGGKLLVGTGRTLTLTNVTTNAGTKLTNSGTLAIKGSTHSIAASTLNLSDRRNTVIFMGDHDDAADNYTITNFSPSFNSIKIGSGSLTDAADTFTLGSAISLTGSGTLSAGTLDVSASNYALALSGSWINAGGDFNARAGTVRFDPGSTSSGVIITGGTGATKAFYNLVFSGQGEIIPKTNDVRTLSGLTLLAGAGHFNNALYDKNMYVDQNVTMDNGAVDMGDATWRVGGNWDNKDVSEGMFNYNSSTVVLSGVNKRFIGRLAYPMHALYNLQVSGSYSVENYLRTQNNVVVTGTITCDASCSFAGPVNNQGTINGTASASFEKNITSVGNLTVSTLNIDGYASTIAAGTYASPTVRFVKSWGDVTRTFGPGRFIFLGNVSIDDSSHANQIHTLNWSTNNPTIEFHGDVRLDENTSSTIQINKGTGTITLSGSNVQEVNFLGKAVEDIVINKSGGSVTMSGAVITDSFDLQRGTVDFNGKAITTIGNFTIGTNGNVTAAGLPSSVLTVGGNFRADGSDSDLLTLNSSSAWDITVAGTAEATYVDVAHSDASGGTPILCSTGCTNSLNNTNWLFPVSGHVYATDGITPLPNVTVALSIDGAAMIDGHLDDTDVNGLFLINLGDTLLQNGDVLTLYLDGETQKAVTVTVTDGADQGGITLVQNALGIDGNNGGNVTTAILGTADNSGDLDLSDFYAIVGSDLTVSAGKTLRINNGATFAPDGTVAAEDVVVEGTLSLGSHNLTASGDWESADGSVTGTSTITLTGTDVSLAASGSTLPNLTLSETPGTVTMSGALAVTGNLTTGTGRTLKASGATLAVNGTYTNFGTLRLIGTEETGGFENDTAHGTVMFTGNDTYDGLAGLTAFNNLTMSGAGTWTLSDSIAISGSLLLASSTLNQANQGIMVKSWNDTGGTFIKGGTVTFTGSGSVTANDPFDELVIDSDAESVTVSAPLSVSGSLLLKTGQLAIGNTDPSVSVEGDWENEFGSLSAGSGTVIMSGDEQTMSGSTLFWNLTKRVGSGATWTFGAGDTQSVRGTWTARGAAGQTLFLRSSDAGAQWKINPAAYDLAFIDIRDSWNIGTSTILAANDAINSGNNTNWAFPVAITAYNDKGQTIVSEGMTVALSVDGGVPVRSTTNAQGLATFNDGNPDHTVLVESGSVLTIFFDDETPNGVTTTVTNGTSLAFPLYRNHLIVRHETGPWITNTHLAVADNSGDTDIASLFTMSGTALTMADATTLLVWVGSTYKPGGPVSAHDLDIDGTLIMEGYDLIVTGSLDATGGTFTASNVIFQAASPETITTDGNSFQDVTFTVTGENGSWTTDTLTVTGTQTVENDAATYDVTPPVITSATGAHLYDTTAIITWTTDEASDSTVVYGTNSGSLSLREEDTALNRGHSVTLTDLTPATTYYFTVASSDISGNATTGSLLSFTTMAALSTAEEVAEAVSEAGGGGSTKKHPCTLQTAMEMTDLAVTTASGGTATVTWETDYDAISMVQYGREAITEFNRFQSDTFVTEHAITLKQLQSSTEYRLQASSLDACGHVVTSDAISFLTESGAALSDDALGTQLEEEAQAQDLLDKAAAIIQKYASQLLIGEKKNLALTQQELLDSITSLIPGPALGGEPKVEASDTSATVLWTTDEEANGIVEYSEAALFTGGKYVFNVGMTDVFDMEHANTLTGLKPGTLYHFRVRSSTPYGTETVSRDFTFVTKQQAIVILNYSIDITSTEAVTFRWTTNVDTDTRLNVTPYRNGELRPQDVLSLKADALSMTHTMRFDRFESGTYYDVEMSGRDSAGNITSKVIARFSTADEDLPPVILTVRTDAAIVPGKDSRIQTVISWDTNEQATGRVYYQKGISSDTAAELKQSTPLNPNYTREHVVLLPSLEPGEVYSFQIESMDSQGNLTRTKTYTLLTPKEKEGVLQVIIKQMEETFGWVGEMRK